MFKERPHSVLSHDGTSVLNIWFLPHHSEVLTIYKKMNDVECRQALVNHLTIVAALNDILQYLCAYARLGSSTLHGSDHLTADWGGIDGVGENTSVPSARTLLCSWGSSDDDVYDMGTR